jgi:hypothetical protein
MIKFILSVILGTAANNVFAQTYTVDGIQVEILPMQESVILKKGQSVAVAKYDESGAVIYYDEVLFSKISNFSKFLIIEHERAHHILGHTLSTKMHGEAGAPIPHSHTYRKEKDADCYAGFRIADVYPKMKAQDINQSFMEIYKILGGESHEIPDWLRSRVNTIVTCYEGKLLPEPAVWVAEVGN